MADTPAPFGFIAGPNGEYDWIVMDPAVDVAALNKKFDTAVMRRQTYEEVTAQAADTAKFRGLRSWVGRQCRLGLLVPADPWWLNLTESRRQRVSH